MATWKWKQKTYGDRVILGKNTHIPKGIGGERTEIICGERINHLVEQKCLEKKTFGG